MNLIQPWKIEVGHLNVADRYDMEAFGLEVFNLNMMATGEDVTQQHLDPELMQVLLDMRDNIITPAVIDYARTVFDYDMVDRFGVETNAKWIPQGEGLFPHYHPGSCISVIVYPDDSKTGLNMFDPRTNACRGYPKQIRDKFFAAWKISPKAGDVFIFPSYLQHSVSYVAEDVRLSLLHEYYLHQNV